MLKAALKLFLGSLLGKIVGVGREVLLASLFGTGSAVAALRVAQTATMIPVQFFVSDSLNAAFVPLYSTYVSDSQRRQQHLFAVVAAVLLCISVGVCTILLLGTSQWVALLAPGLDRSTSVLASGFLGIMALSVPFVVLGALFAYLEMANRSYTLASLRATVQSVGLILGTLAAHWLSRPELLAWGFTGAYIVFTAWALCLLKSRGFLAWPRPWVWRESLEALRQFWAVLRPLMLLPAMLQGAIAIERAVASLLGTSAVAGLDYAKFITETGVLLLAVPLGLASLSTLGGLTREEVRNKLAEFLPAMIVLTAPFSAFLMINAEGVIRILYARGAFGDQSVTTTSAVLGGLAMGFWAQVAGYTLVKALNAQLRNREVLIYMAAGLLTQSVLNLTLHPIFGPYTLGISSSVYGLVLFLLTMRAFDLTRPLSRHLLWIGFGILVYTPVGLSCSSSTWQGVLLGGTVFIAFWTLWVWLAPPLRETAAGFLRRARAGAI